MGSGVLAKNARKVIFFTISKSSAETAVRKINERGERRSGSRARPEHCLTGCIYAENYIGMESMDRESTTRGTELLNPAADAGGRRKGSVLLRDARESPHE